MTSRRVRERCVGWTVVYVGHNADQADCGERIGVREQAASWARRGPTRLATLLHDVRLGAPCFPPHRLCLSIRF